MSKELQVVAWDDIHLAGGVRVQATHIDVPVEFGSLKGVLDLDDDHFDQAEAVFRELFGAVFARESREAAAGEEVPARRRGKKNQGTAPLEKLCPFPAGSKGRRDYLIGLRMWADREGRGGDYRPPESSNKNMNEYHYPKQLLLDYNAFLSEEAQKLAS